MLEEFERQENENKQALEELKKSKSKKEVIICEQYPLFCYIFFSFFKIYINNYIILLNTYLQHLHCNVLPDFVRILFLSNNYFISISCSNELLSV